jgi:dihydroorotase
MRNTTARAITIRGGRIIDPAARRDEIADLHVIDGLIADRPPVGASETIDAEGCIVCPGLMDIHVHFREPGFTHKETIESGTRAAAAGGFTFAAPMPNTRPPHDSPETVRFVIDRAREAGWCAVGPVGCITIGRSGKVLADLGAMRDAGAVAFSDDGDGVEDDAVMLAAFEAAARLGVVLIQHCEYKALSKGGVMHLGDVSRAIGLPGLDPRSEEAMIERDIDLCRRTGGRYHVAHISTARAIELVRAAKRGGLPVTSEVCTHHLVLTDEAGRTQDPNTKMHPPLRPAADVEACRRGLVDGTIDCIVTDHAPHAAEEKAKGFLAAPAGIVGLETAVPLAARAMVESGLADWPRLVAWFTTESARVLGLRAPSLAPGRPADVSMLDPSAAWVVDPAAFQSMSRNTPFAGWTLRGRARGTLRGTQLVSMG